MSQLTISAGLVRHLRAHPPSVVVDYRCPGLPRLCAPSASFGGSFLAGIDRNTVRELLGHKSVAMTLRYARLAPEHKAAAVEVLVARARDSVAA